MNENELENQNSGDNSSDSAITVSGGSVNVVLSGNEPDTNTVIQLDADQLQDIIDAIEDSQPIIESNADTPSDFFTYIADTQGQTIFFLSLICGMLLGFIFCYALKRS